MEDRASWHSSFRGHGYHQWREVCLVFIPFNRPEEGLLCQGEAALGRTWNFMLELMSLPTNLSLSFWSLTTPDNAGQLSVMGRHSSCPRVSYQSQANVDLSFSIRLTRQGKNLSSDLWSCRVMITIWCLACISPGSFVTEKAASLKQQTRKYKHWENVVETIWVLSTKKGCAERDKNYRWPLIPTHYHAESSSENQRLKIYFKSQTQYIHFFP